MSLNRADIVRLLSEREDRIRAQPGSSSRMEHTHALTKDEFIAMTLDALARNHSPDVPLIREIFGSLCDVVRIHDFRVDPVQTRVGRNEIQLRCTFDMRQRHRTDRPVTAQWIQELP